MNVGEPKLNWENLWRDQCPKCGAPLVKLHGRGRECSLHKSQLRDFSVNACDFFITAKRMSELRQKHYRELRREENRP